MQTMRIIETTAAQWGVFVQMRGVLLQAGTERQPDKRLAASMLAAIERFPDNPGRERILECVRQTLTKPHSAPTSAGSQSGSA
jgi:hypothetical protein